MLDDASSWQHLSSLVPRCGWRVVDSVVAGITVRVLDDVW